MSGAPPIRPAGLPDDAAGREAMAGEYVLGTLDARTAARVVVAIQADPEWQKKRAESEANGPIVANIRNEILTPTAFSAVK